MSLFSPSDATCSHFSLISNSYDDNLRPAGESSPALLVCRTRKPIDRTESNARRIFVYFNHKRLLITHQSRLAVRTLQFTWCISFSGLLGSVRWFDIGVSGLHIDPIFKDRAVQEETSICKPFFFSREMQYLNCITEVHFGRYVECDISVRPSVSPWRSISA